MVLFDTRLLVFLVPLCFRFNSCWKIHIHTADQDNAGTDSTILIKLFGDKGETSRDISLDNAFSNDFERGQIDNFDIKPYLLNDFNQMSSLSSIEIWMLYGYTLFQDWKVDSIVVTNENGKHIFTFPVVQWIKPGRRYNFSLYCTSLPRTETYPEQRNIQLNETRDDYKYGPFYQNNGLDIAGFRYAPVDEKPSKKVIAERLAAEVGASLTDKLDVFWNGKEWKSIESMKKQVLEMDYSKNIEGLDFWKDDIHFGAQRLSGANNEIIKLFTNVSAKFPITDVLLGTLLEGLTIKKAIAQKRLFLCDYEILHKITTKNGFIVTAPIGLFFLDGSKNLKPVAIQLFQEPGHKNPIFTPNDLPNTWVFAKMWFNLADVSHHQTVTHFGQSHLIMEGIVLATHRNLAINHPVFKLLAPHFFFTVAVNVFGRSTLIGEGGFVDNYMNLGAKGFFDGSQRAVGRWRMDLNGDFLEFLRHRGVEDPSVLPGYSFRDDGILVHDAIQKYVKEYVALYYDSKTTVRTDKELQAWAEELVRPIHDTEPGCGLKGVPGNGKLTTSIELVNLLTSVIFTCSAQHAAANFKQVTQGGFTPNWPTMMRGTPPQSKDEVVTDEDLLHSMPNREEWRKIWRFGLKLAVMRGPPLGQFKVDYIADPPAVEVVERFRARLRTVSDVIKQRNRERRHPYVTLDPDNIPNSISS